MRRRRATAEGAKGRERHALGWVVCPTPGCGGEEKVPANAKLRSCARCTQRDALALHDPLAPK